VEVRGVGVLRLPSVSPPLPLVVVVDLADSEERLPLPQVARYGACTVPRFVLQAHTPMLALKTAYACKLTMGLVSPWITPCG
jgi:hypothetical protein